MNDFPKEEFTQRVDRLQEAMSLADLDAVFLNTDEDIRYFSGFRTQFWKSPTRSWYLIIPVKGKPMAIIPEIGAALMRKTWIEDIKTFVAPHPEPQELPLLRTALANFKRIGMPMGEESILRMPYERFLQLSETINGAFVNVTPMIRALQSVKSKREIAVIARICEIAGRAFDRAGELFYEKQSLKKAFAAFQVALIQEGAESVEYLVGGTGRSGYDSIIAPPDETPLQNGDVLMLDTGCMLQGYYCDFDRNFAIGNTSAETKAAYERLWQATEAGLATAKVGATTHDVFMSMSEVIGEPGGMVGRLGHGLGMKLTEWPSVMYGEHVKLEENMVITLEPACTVKPGFSLVTEENIVIGKDKPRLLTKHAPRELPVL